MLLPDQHTERLILRKIDPDVMNYVMTYYNDDQLMEFFGFEDTNLLLREKDRHEKGRASYSRSYCYFHILDKTEKKYLGWCGYHTYYTVHSRAEIGYEFIDDASKGKGLMSEAMKYIIDFGFRTMQLNRIEAFVGPSNLPSLKLMIKFGFTKEGQLRSHFFKNSKYEDSVVFSILQDEYIG